MSATDVPPNFITRRAMATDASSMYSMRRRNRAGAPAEKARIHTGGFGGCNRGARLTIREQRMAQNAAAPERPKHGRPRPKWSGFRRWPPTGGTRAARWRRCTSSTRCGSAYIRDQAAGRFGRDAKRLGCLAGLRILDIGCGGGLLSRAAGAARRHVVGADPAEDNIEIAKRHAAQSDLAIDYRATTAEALADAGEKFDIVLAMEVVEHVADVQLFMRAAPRW